MPYSEQIYRKVQVCQGPTGDDPAVRRFTGRFRKLYFLETTTITEFQTVGDTLTTNFAAPSGRPRIECFKGTSIEGITITEFAIHKSDQQSASRAGTILAYS